MKNNELHCCDDLYLPIDKYLQIGSGLGKRLLVVGESPAKNWLQSGRAFFTENNKVVATGKNFLINLNQISSDLNLENISFTELSKCHIGTNRNKLVYCAKKVWPHFIEQINYIQPKIIILLGKHTTDVFNQLADTKLEVGVLHKIKILDKNFSILPIYHPSPLNPKRVQNVDFINLFKKDILKLLH